MNRLWNYCAFCGKRIETGEKCWGLPMPPRLLPKYCPNCGAKMDGGNAKG